MNTDKKNLINAKKYKLTATKSRVINESAASNNFFGNLAFIATVAACLAGNIGNAAVSLFISIMYLILIAKPEYLIAPIFFLTIFDEYILAVQSVSFSRICVIFFVVGVLTYMILNLTKIKKGTFFSVAVMFFGIFLSFYSIFGFTSFPMPYVTNIVLAIAMINYINHNNRISTKAIYKYCVLAVAYVIYLLLLNGTDSIVEDARMSIDENVNSNLLGMGLAVVTVLIVTNLILSNKNRIFNILLIIISCIGLFMTGSRSAFIAAAVSSFIIYIISCMGNRKNSIRAIFFFIIGVCAIMLIYSFMRKYFPVLMERFTVESVTKSGGTGRVDVWKAFFRDYFPTYWPLGIGFDGMNMYYAAYLSNGTGHGAHNVLIEILSCSGVVGLMIYSAYFMGYFKTTIKYFKTDKTVLYSLAIVITTLVNGIGENVLTTRFLWTGIGLGFMLCNTRKNILGRRVC